MQLSFLNIEPTAIDINAVDGGVVLDLESPGKDAAESLALRSVDDWVFALGFTNWKNVIDHAFVCGHHELYASEDGLLGLRKHGYRYAPIPRLPMLGARYVRQKLLLLASEQGLYTSRSERMNHISDSVGFKFYIEDAAAHFTIKSAERVIQIRLPIFELPFSSTSLTEHDELASHLAVELVRTGAAQLPDLAKLRRLMVAALIKSTQVAKK